MGANDDPQETEPLRDSTRGESGDSLQVLDMEKHVLTEGEPREPFLRKGGQHPEKWTLIIVAVGAILLLASLVVRGRRVYGQIVTQDNPLYEFVGEGNCKPNRPQFVGEKVPYDQCREKCDMLGACIGFDWDARWTVCRLRFYTNAAIASPPPGFRAMPGTEGGRLQRQTMVSGFLGVEGSHTAGCFQKTDLVPFQRLLSQPRLDGQGIAHVGPLPNVLVYYLDAGLLGPLSLCKQHMKVGPTQDLLEYSGKGEEMILPSLDSSPLLRAMRKEFLESVTLVVGMNTDRNGLRVTVEASPQINETEEEHGDSYIISERRITRNTNVITFYPDSTLDGLSIEGPGGFADSLGFLPSGWSAADHKLNRLEITTHSDGENKLVFVPAQGGHRWERWWRHKLFDGRDTPTLYASKDSTSVETPLIIGRVSMKAEALY
mmetsp:Transcript_19382/g.45460  ORF Transcript_19382/g.45460 Transcript_19382/m.45460 type:complete len:432 (-) Transcript_19382:70-1365(-)